MRVLLSCLLLVAVALASQKEDDIWTSLQKLRDFSLPNFAGCEQTKACFTDLMTSVGVSTDPLPSYATYTNKMTASYSKGVALEQYCGTFDAVQHCFSQESDSCRSPTVFATLFNLTSDDAYRYASDLDLRKIMCDNQLEMQDPCFNKLPAVKTITPIENDAAATCTTAAADFSAMMSQAADTGCPDAVTSASCQISQKTQEIEALGVCDGKLPKCWTAFHSCDRMQGCFQQFYDGIDKLGVKSPLPDYAAYKKSMTRQFENANGIDSMCRLQETLHACLIRNTNKNCPLNAASFRKMFNLNYEQAYDYSTDFALRKAQCINRDGIKQNTCYALSAAPLLKICEPDIPHNLTLGKACTDLRLAMKCSNFMVRQECSKSVEAQKAYCATTEIQYQQGALGFCDGWLPSCDEIGVSTTKAPVPEQPTKGPVKTTKNPDTPTKPTVPVPPVTSTTVEPVQPTTSFVTSAKLSVIAMLLVTLRLTL